MPEIRTFKTPLGAAEPVQKEVLITWKMGKFSKFGKKGFSCIRAQIKHTKKFSIKNFGTPKTAHLNSLCLGFFLCFEEKGGPKHKEFTGVRGPLGGGLGGGVSGNILYVYAFSRGFSCIAISDCILGSHAGVACSAAFGGWACVTQCVGPPSWCWLVDNPRLHLQEGALQAHREGERGDEGFHRPSPRKPTDPPPIRKA